MTLNVGHNVDTYELGGGVVSAAYWDGINPPEEADFFDLGNASAFGYQVTVTMLEHKSSRGGQMVVDKKVVKEKGYTCSVTLDEPNIVNLAMFLKGEISGNTILALENPNQEVALRFVSDNDAGENHIADFWRASIEPNGEFQEVSLDNWKELKMNFTGLEDSANHPTNAYFKVVKVDITT